MHIGGDENEGKQGTPIRRSSLLKEKGIKDNHALQAYSINALKLLKKHHRKMIGGKRYCI